jgi:hypothetical protein
MKKLLNVLKMTKSNTKVLFAINLKNFLCINIAKT